mgnify:CR=1 FL=1
MCRAEQRIKPGYTEELSIPCGMEKYLWEHKKTAPLEKIILRVLLYGKFEEIKQLFILYPKETLSTSDKYPEIKRGVRFWIKRWYDAKNV